VLTFLLFASMLYVMLMRVYLPMGAKLRGKVTRRVSLSLVERFLWQRVNLYAIGAVLLLMIVTRSVATPAEVLVLLTAQVILALPLRCIVTSEGVALNNVVFRPWSDFAGFSVAPRRVVLIGRAGTRPMSVPLLAGHQKALVTALKRHLPEVRSGKEAWPDHEATVG
jgi:hypothetical protein